MNILFYFFKHVLQYIVTVASFRYENNVSKSFFILSTIINVSNVSILLNLEKNVRETLILPTSDIKMKDEILTILNVFTLQKYCINVFVMLTFCRYVQSQVFAPFSL